MIVVRRGDHRQQPFESRKILIFYGRHRPTNDDQILAVPGDVSDRKTAERAISEGLARFGRVDTLINNAGLFVSKPFTQYTEADYAAVLGVNLTGFFHITQLAIAEMEKRQSGHIVQITTSWIDHANSRVPCVLASLTKGGGRHHDDQQHRHTAGLQHAPCQTDNLIGLSGAEPRQSRRRR
jgi:NAD(P)-dependent dehydrogenase (short-subunit alcohol dehydrogenase family)